MSDTPKDPGGENESELGTKKPLDTWKTVAMPVFSGYTQETPKSNEPPQPVNPPSAADSAASAKTMLYTPAQMGKSSTDPERPAYPSAPVPAPGYPSPQAQPPASPAYPSQQAPVQTSAYPSASAQQQPTGYPGASPSSPPQPGYGGAPGYPSQQPPVQQQQPPQQPPRYAPQPNAYPQPGGPSPAYGQQPVYGSQPQGQGLAPQYGQQQYGQPAKKSKVWVWVLVVIVSLLILGVIGCIGIFYVIGKNAPAATPGLAVAKLHMHVAKGEEAAIYDEADPSYRENVTREASDAEFGRITTLLGTPTTFRVIETSKVDVPGDVVNVLALTTFSKGSANEKMQLRKNDDSYRMVAYGIESDNLR